jgi:preprotein translocase subunit SecD
MARNVSKKPRPLRTLSILILIIIALYGSIGFNVVQLHWNDAPAEAAPENPTAEEDPSATEEDGTEEPDGDEIAEPTDSDSSETATTPTENTHATDPVSFIPKFALDLAGGTELILKAETEDGSTPDDNALDQAIDVIRQRIDASGVAEAEINKQGDSNIVVGIPGETPSDETIKLISNAAKMNFRPVIALGGANGKYYSAALGTKSATATATTPDATKYDLDGDGQVQSAEEIQAWADDLNLEDKATYESTLASDAANGSSKFSVVTEEDIAAFDALDCTKDENRKGGSAGDSSKPLATCDTDGTGKYMLAPVAVEGDQISRAQAGLKPLANGKTGTDWVVSLQFKDEGDDDFISISQQIKVLDSPRNQFAITLDGLVISAPSIQPDTTFVKGNGVEISSGQTGGEATRVWATTLSNQLSFGALPMNFTVDSKEQVSATLGGEQLEKGLLAGLAGLLLVILFSLKQYRALGLVTVGSLAIATALTYGTVLFLSWQIGYRLSLPGIIGFIVSIGITADSFIVYFERIRDELRDGRNLDLALSRGWQRAKQTILASDTVNVLCAVILYMLAVGGVRGFAFTLGLTTFIDLIVVFMFTHPIVILLSKLHFFKEGHPLSGLSAFNLGADNARKYRAKSQEAKDEYTEEKRLAKETKREQRADLKQSKHAARDLVREQNKVAKTHRLEHEAIMEKKAELLAAGADIEDIIDVNLSIAERKAIAEGKDIKKLKSHVLFDDDLDQEYSKKHEAAQKSAKKVEDAQVDDKPAPAKKPAAKKPAVKKAPAKKPAAKKATSKTASDEKKPAAKAKAPVKKAPAKSTTSKPAAKKSTSTAKKAPAKKPAATATKKGASN